MINTLLFFLLPHLETDGCARQCLIIEAFGCLGMSRSVSLMSPKPPPLSLASPFDQQYWFLFLFFNFFPLFFTIWPLQKFQRDISKRIANALCVDIRTRWNGLIYPQSAIALPWNTCWAKRDQISPFKLMASAGWVSRWSLECLVYRRRSARPLLVASPQHRLQGGKGSFNSWSFLSSRMCYSFFIFHLAVLDFP